MHFKNRIGVIVLSLGLISLASCHSKQSMSEQPDLDTTPSNGKWISLFDGKTTNGWHTFKKSTATNWAVVDGALTRTGNGGDLVTDNKYGNFILELDWKIDPKGNSGVIYRTDETDTATHWVGPEVQILDTGKDSPNEKHATAACYDLYAPAVDARKDPGEWNHFRIVCDGPHITHFLNGKKVCEYTIGSDDWNQRVAASKFKTHSKYATLKSGQIALQDHHSSPQFKNIRLMPLDQ